jgi:acetoin utilization protein AcuC
VVDVVPRAWTHLLATATGAPVADSTPEDWRALARERADEFAPTSMSDGRDTSYQPWVGGHGDPDERLDMAVADTRRHVFALHGLDPLA